MLVASRSTCIGAIGKFPTLLVTGLSVRSLLLAVLHSSISPEHLIFSCPHLPYTDRSDCSTQSTTLAWLELGYPTAIERKGAMDGSWSRSTFNPYICLMVLDPCPLLLPPLLSWYMPDMLLYFIVSKVLLSSPSHLR